MERLNPFFILFYIDRSANSSQTKKNKRQHCPLSEKYISLHRQQEMYKFGGDSVGYRWQGNLQ